MIAFIIKELENKIIKELYKNIYRYLKTFQKADNRLYNFKIRTKYRFISISNFTIINSIRNYIVLGKKQKETISRNFKRSKVSTFLKLKIIQLLAYKNFLYQELNILLTIKYVVGKNFNKKIKREFNIKDITVQKEYYQIHKYFTSQ